MRGARLRLAQDRRRLADELQAGRVRERLRQLPDDRLASGPGLVCAAFGIDLAMSGLDLLDPDSPLRLETPGTRDGDLDVAAGPRVGVEYAGPPWSRLAWRLTIAGHPSLSGPSLSDPPLSDRSRFRPVRGPRLERPGR